MRRTARRLLLVLPLTWAAAPPGLTPEESAAGTRCQPLMDAGDVRPPPPPRPSVRR